MLLGNNAGIIFSWKGGIESELNYQGKFGSCSIKQEIKKGGKA